MPALPPQRLTEEEYWDDLHLAERASKVQAQRTREAVRPPVGRQLKSRLKGLLGTKLLESLRSYEEFRLWEVILPRYLARQRGAKVVEIGSAPGDLLVRLNRRFDLTPYGIEYSTVGAKLNRDVFAANGVDPGNVIEADFLAPHLHEQYQEAFDVVLSNGFIEHFPDVDAIVQKHLSLLKPGGRLVVIIPNLRGVNFLLAWLFRRDVLAMHNLDIMTREKFAALFERQSLERLFCDYYGTFNFYLFHTGPGSLMRLPLALCMKLQLVLNLLFRSLFKDKGAESRWFSPSLLYVGIKR